MLALMTSDHCDHRTSGIFDVSSSTTSAPSSTSTPMLSTASCTIRGDPTATNTSTSSSSPGKISEKASKTPSPKVPSVKTTPSTSTSAASSTMPVLLHHSKRKRLDDVLTKLSLSFKEEVSPEVSSHAVPSSTTPTDPAPVSPSPFTTTHETEPLPSSSKQPNAQETQVKQKKEESQSFVKEEEDTPIPRYHSPASNLEEKPPSPEPMVGIISGTSEDEPEDESKEEGSVMNAEKSVTSTPPQKQRSVDSEMAMECRLMALDDQQQHQQKEQQQQLTGASSLLAKTLTHSIAGREWSFKWSSTEEHEVSDTALTTSLRHTSRNLVLEEGQEAVAAPSVAAHPSLSSCSPSASPPPAKLVTQRRVPDTNPSEQLLTKPSPFSSTSSVPAVSAAATSASVESGPASAPPFCASLLSRAYLGRLSSLQTCPDTCSSSTSTLSTSNTFPPTCDCAHCRTIFTTSASTMPTLSATAAQISGHPHPHYPHAWSWHSLQQQQQHSQASPPTRMLLDPFAYLLSTSAAKSAFSSGQLHELPSTTSAAMMMASKSASPPLSLEQATQQFHQHQQQQQHQLTLLELAKAAQQSCVNQKKRSHSDSDMTAEYLHLFKTALAARRKAELAQAQAQVQAQLQQQQLQQHLQPSEPGSVLLKNGRRVPKPLAVKAEPVQIIREIPQTPDLQLQQESPLDLSTSSSSAPSSLYTLSSRPFRFSDSTSAETSSPSTAASSPFLLSHQHSQQQQHSTESSFSLRATVAPMSLVVPKKSAKKSSHSSTSSSSQQPLPPKRSNIIGSTSGHCGSADSASLNSSSLSSISSLSPPYLSAASAGSEMKVSKSAGLPPPPSTPSRGSNRGGNQRFDFADERQHRRSPLDVPQHVSMTSTTTSEHSATEPESASSGAASAVSSSNHACILCGQTFLFYDRLAKHMASRHRKSGDTVKNYQCGICHRSFARSDMLTRHMRLHTGHKPYTCAICDQVFSRSDHLSTHQRTHTGDKPYKCPQCPYAACRRDMITRHMKTHSRYEIPDSSTKSA